MTGRDPLHRDDMSIGPCAGPGQPAVAGVGSRWLYLWIGYANLALAAVGVVLPLVPTVPFLLLAAWAFARSDPRLLERIHRDPRFGPLLRGWQTEHAIPIQAKLAAVVMMAGSWTVVALTASGPLVPVLLGLVLALVALFILTRPAPRAAAAPLDPPSAQPAPRRSDADVPGPERS